MKKNKFGLLRSTLKAVEGEDGVLKIEGYASTTDKDRAGDIILAEAWAKGLANYEKNPILLFNHNYNEPVGRVTSISIDSKGLAVKGEISASAQRIYGLIKDQVLSTFSVGFMVKEADYDRETDISVIKEAELLEISVVSVPCNQDATFSVAKSFDSEKAYRDYLKSNVEPVEQSTEDSVNAQDSVGETTDDRDSSQKEIDMTPEELQALIAEATTKAATDAVAAASAKAVEDAKAKAEAEEAEKQFNIKVTTAAERLLQDVEKRFSEKNEGLETIISELKNELSEKSAEIVKIRDSKRHFTDRSGSADWKKEFEQDMADTFVLGLATGKGWNTDAAKSLIEKVNAHSSVEVSSADFEQTVSTNIERDIQNELILAPMFRELPMNSATMILPIMPDAGYAEFVSTSTTDATAPKGNLDQRSATYGDEAGVALGERTVSTKKLMSLSYLGNETEEDAILPILPLIRESMVRSHARAVEQAILVGNHADGVYGTSGASFDGLIKLAADDSQTTQPTGNFATSDVVTAADLFGLRKNMGKYGLRPEDVVYIVSQDVYYNLIEDSEFQDANLVGEQTATKLKGKIGSVYGSNVVVCDEFAAKAAGSFNAIAVNTRNFLVPRLRGITVESDYETKEQRRVLVATQRLGFVDIIDGAASKWALQYKAV